MKFPTFYISHGGGPWPWMKEQAPVYTKLEASLKGIPGQLPSIPKAILMISAHWEEPQFKIMSSPQPPMLYDYGGFPEHTYRIRYQAPGDPNLAVKIQEMVEGSLLDSERGFDHGAFVPLFVMYPNAEIPVVQISLKKGLDAETHLNLGNTLAPLREEGVLILASGSSFHNLRSYFDPKLSTEHSQAFDSWLNKTVLLEDFKTRHQELLQWAKAPGARNSHPREEHLIPLMVALGAADAESAKVIYHEDKFLVGAAMTSFRFGS